MRPSIFIVIVTHNSGADLQHCLDCIANQTEPVQGVIVVDSGSEPTDYLKSLQFVGPLDVVYCDNVGYGKGNNTGFKRLQTNEDGLVVFMNPDTYLRPDFCSALLGITRTYDDVAVFSGRLLSFDRKMEAPTGRLDSTGIFRNWYGRWYDRGRGEMDKGQYDSTEIGITAACGALLCCRQKDLLECHGQIFDPDFFLYKEDIEFSIRMRKHGKKIGYFPHLVAYHCRGWQEKRKTMDFSLRLVSAENEVLLYRKHPSVYICWALLKLVLVRYLKF